MPLTFAEKDMPYKILKIAGKDEIRSYLQNLGFAVNETISVKQSNRGNLIVEVKGVRVALDASLAKRIMV